MGWKGEGELGLERRGTGLEGQSSLKPREEIEGVLSICSLDLGRPVVQAPHH